MATEGLAQTLLDPTRFSIVSLLAATDWAEFGFVRDTVGLSDSALSKQVTTLTRLEFVEVDKGYVGKRPRTWLRLSATGRSALGRHVAALQQIAAAATEHGAAHRTEMGPATA
ncbi:transcriptional regulator [Dactylosporangium sp. NPDC051485]|uniref:transcriptional regulator n=1 Tax=Dactylosporangium sp. NPDC051485 TaxID=3154846 RepID=UPI003418A85C